MSFHPRRPSPSAVYLAVWGVFTFANATAFTLVQLLLVRDLGLGPFALVLVGSVLEAACFVLGVPTGLYADLRGRRRSVVVGLVLAAVGFGVLATAGGLLAVLAGMVLWGAGFTFIAGAAEAWLTDRIGVEASAAVFQREQQVLLVAQFGGVLAAGGLGLVGLRAPLIVAALLVAAAAVGAAALMGRDAPAPADDDGPSALALLRDGLTLAARTPTVRTVLLVTALAGAASEAFDRLWTLRVVDGLGLPPGLPEETWFTLFALVSSLIALAASLLAGRFAGQRLQAADPRRVLAVLVIVQAAGAAGFAASGVLWPAMAAMWLRDAAAAVAQPVQAAWLNRAADDRSRATVFSLAGQADALGQIAGGPAIGALASTRGLTTGLLTSATVLLPAALVLAVRRRGARPPTAVDDAQAGSSDRRGSGLE